MSQILLRNQCVIFPSSLPEQVFISEARRTVFFSQILMSSFKNCLPSDLSCILIRIARHREIRRKDNEISECFCQLSRCNIKLNENIELKLSIEALQG